LFDFGHLNRSVTLELTPDPSVDRASFSIGDDRVMSGVNPYRVKSWDVQILCSVPST